MEVPIILASSSAGRLALLRQAKIIPNLVVAPDIDETPYPRELPSELAIRLAKTKALKASEDIPVGYVISADTVVAIGRRILPKALTIHDIKFCLQLLSGRRHQIYTGVSIIRKENNVDIASRHRIVKTLIRIKRLTEREIEHYMSIGEGIGKSGGYAINGVMETYIVFISGSYSSVIGLPLFHVKNMLESLGFKTLH